MRSNKQLTIVAYVEKTTMERYEYNTTGMSTDEIHEVMENAAFVEDEDNWEWIDTEVIHSEITTELKILSSGDKL